MAALVDMGHTVVDGRHTDLRFLSVQELNDMIESEKPVNPYTSAYSQWATAGN